MVVQAIATAMWAMLPAYIPNNAAVLLGGGRPIDGGRTWGGRRLLGDGKTWRGTGGGALAGVAVAGVLNGVQPTMAEITGLIFPVFPPTVAVALAVGAMLGDVLASFLKRRTGRERGAPLPVVDQLDFAVAALVLVGIVAPNWFTVTFLQPSTVLVAVFVLTPLLHLSTNLGAYVLGLKDEPY